MVQRDILYKLFFHLGVILKQKLEHALVTKETG